MLAVAGNATGLVREADRALYSAKAARRNRTVVADVSHDLVPHPEVSSTPSV